MVNQHKVIELVKSTKSIVNQLELRKHVQMKGASDFVTDVDFAISSFLKEELAKLNPEIGFFSEEEEGALSDPSWILDPIDGTTNLVYGYRLSSVSLGLYANGAIQFGVVYNPFTDECFTATLGGGAYLDGKQLKVSNRGIEESLIEFGAGSTKKQYTEETFELVKDIFRHCIDVRRICSSALDLCYIADGRIDGYFERVLKPWDIAAGSLILREAGGAITDYQGNDVQYAQPTSVIAGNGVVNAFLLDAVKRHIK